MLFSQVVLETLENDAALLAATLGVDERDDGVEAGLDVAQLRVKLGMLDGIGRVALEEAADGRVRLHGLGRLLSELGQKRAKAFGE